MKEHKYKVSLYISNQEVIVYEIKAAESEMHAKSLARQASVKAGDKFADKIEVEQVTA